ncbi:FHA domain-containing protein [Kaarinaea lacus]
MKHPTHQAPHSDFPRSVNTSIHDSPVSHPGHGSLTQAPSESGEELERRLILTLEGKIIREYPFEKSTLNIGRRHGNDIQLNDPSLSGRHARISCKPDNVFVEDLGSTNGTLVNGCHITRAALSHGDVIQIGHHHLTYLCENNAPYVPTMFIKAEHDETQFIYSENINNNSIEKGLALAGLRTVSDNPGHAIPVMELRKTYSTIGFRGKRMAVITRATHGYSISMISGSHNRRASDIPLLNGKQLEKESSPLETGDIITIAGYDIEFYFLN